MAITSKRLEIFRVWFYHSIANWNISFTAVLEILPHPRALTKMRESESWNLSFQIFRLFRVNYSSPKGLNRALFTIKNRYTFPFRMLKSVWKSMVPFSRYKALKFWYQFLGCTPYENQIYVELLSTVLAKIRAYRFYSQNDISRSIRDIIESSHIVKI